MIQLLRIHSLVRWARTLIFFGKVAEAVSIACRRRAGSILDEATAWADAMDARRARLRRESAVKLQFLKCFSKIGSFIFQDPINNKT